MIYIDRYRKDQRGHLITPGDDWFETAKKHTANAIKEGQDHVVTDHYKAVGSKRALKELFHGKCAYCESDIEHADIEVEHFRPKGGVKEAPSHPGYYWLAYTWENLYPACTHCNQLRKPVDQPGEPTKGKDTQFPLLDETKRVLKPDQELKMESPLLLDPCNPEQDPEDHLCYRPDGGIFSEDDYGKITIEVCHLNRFGLKRIRAKKLQLLVLLLKLNQYPELAQLDGIDLVGLSNRLVSPAQAHAGLGRYFFKHPELLVPGQEPLG